MDNRRVLLLEAGEQYDDTTIKNLRDILNRERIEIILYSDWWNRGNIEKAGKYLEEHGLESYITDQCSAKENEESHASIKCYISCHSEIERYVIVSKNRRMLVYFPGYTIYCEGLHISDLNRRRIQRIIDCGYWWEHSSLRLTEPYDDGYRRVVFLDIDGVLNDDDKGPKIDRKMVLNLAHIIKDEISEEEAEIVLTSSWRYGLSYSAGHGDFSDREKNAEYFNPQVWV